jgi:hypothetical protein
LRYISPVCFSSSVVAISTENTRTPDLVAISSGWTLAAYATGFVQSAKSNVIAAPSDIIRPQARSRTIIEAKFIKALTPQI